MTFRSAAAAFVLVAVATLAGCATTGAAAATDVKQTGNAVERAVQ